MHACAHTCAPPLYSLCHTLLSKSLLKQETCVRVLAWEYIFFSPIHSDLKGLQMVLCSPDSFSRRALYLLYGGYLAT